MRLYHAQKTPGQRPARRSRATRLFAHNLLVVTPGERVSLGLWHTFVYARDEPEDGKADPKQLPIEQKESFRWLEGYREACALAGLVPGCEVICVGDRESDIYELFVSRKGSNFALCTQRALVRSR